MGMVGTPRSWLPYPFVGKIPVCRNVLSKAHQYFLRGAVKVSVALCVLGRSFYHFTVNIKLKLMSSLHYQCAPAATRSSPRDPVLFPAERSPRKRCTGPAIEVGSIAWHATATS